MALLVVKPWRTAEHIASPRVTMVVKTRGLEAAPSIHCAAPARASASLANELMVTSNILATPLMDHWYVRCLLCLQAKASIVMRLLAPNAIMLPSGNLSTKCAQRHRAHCALLARPTSSRNRQNSTSRRLHLPALLGRECRSQNLGTLG
jgi:hypothetical protein